MYYTKSVKRPVPTGKREYRGFRLINRNRSLLLGFRSQKNCCVAHDFIPAGPSTSPATVTLRSVVVPVVIEKGLSAVMGLTST